MYMDDGEDKSKWSPEKKLKWLTEELKDKADHYRSYTQDGYYYSDEEEASDSGRASAFDDAADDIDWLLRALGIVE